MKNQESNQSDLNLAYSLNGYFPTGNVIPEDGKIKCLQHALEMAKYNTNPPGIESKLEEVLLIANDIFGWDWDEYRDRNAPKLAAFNAISEAVGLATHGSELQRNLALRLDDIAPIIFRFAPEEANAGVDRAITGIEIGSPRQQLDRKLSKLIDAIGDLRVQNKPLAEPRK